ncbi:NemA NADH:flavin oxidoreductase Old Yellow Enzyme family [Pyrenophora tritici-repentis]|uniref:NADH oxidase n=2 Tax=Pyrenophora tritici-repentis TaxID=45151 RepID=A0A2W1FID6_9PLEO|nr:NADH oxidase [Pyrenophora tritici-repentis Pt-1C-BFP]KAA8619967.1 NADH oxidase [Pyrenophora tritici-repentis]EDU46800.1 NADH oxidase [Pyrenophora tritici-repentis Pt-1C-BFP]KAF7448117.1 NADH oxidase [Pyrenophora tritici-repentis]KAF7571829.1 NemA, NADH:flavin oxidoreductase, Old Yellow Enzyme family [Pyrenophora tritici-repentis]KAG9384977.1 NADH oxidase [Pyrenophora tritici-repentis]
MEPRRYEAEHKDPAPLGKPLDFVFSKKTAQNRFLKGAMTERLSSWDPKNLEARGVPSKNLVNVYKHWGKGEFGVILTGNVMIEYDHLEAAGNPIIPRGAPYEGERFEMFKELATASKEHGSLIVAQVSHPGRQVTETIQKKPISASDVQLQGNIMGMTFAKPRAATEQDIKNVIEGFAHAAEYLEKAGYDGIQLHGAHGYLLAQFLSPTTNHRTDAYGGSLENRARLIVEIGQEIRKRTSPNFILSIKLNSVEFQDKGFGTAEAGTLCKMLEDNSFDFVELSGGTYEQLAFSHKRESTKKREAFFLEFAESITPSLTKTRTYVTGGFKTAAAMVDALNTVDGVGLARPVCLEPELPRQILSGEVHAAINQLTDDNDFGATNVAAGTQIRQLGKDQRPIDLSDEKMHEAFQKDMGAWAKGFEEDKEGGKYGYVDIVSVESVPYGGAAPAS